MVLRSVLTQIITSIRTLSDAEVHRRTLSTVRFKTTAGILELVHTIKTPFTPIPNDTSQR